MVDNEFINLFDEEKYRLYFKNISSLENEYMETKKIYVNKLQKNIFNRLRVLAVIISFGIFYLSFMLFKNKLFLYEADKKRLTLIIISIIIIIPLIYQFIFGWKKYADIKENPNNHIKEFVLVNEKHMREVIKCRKNAANALKSRESLELKNVKTRIEDISYKPKMLSKKGVLYCVMILAIQFVLLFTQNSFIYDCALKNVEGFNAKSSERIEWCFKHLPKNYKEIKSIKADYAIVEDYIHKLDNYTTKEFNENTERNVVGLENDAPHFSIEVIENYWMIQELSKELNNKWSFTPYLQSINLMYMVDGMYMVSVDGQGYFYITADDFNDNHFNFRFKAGTFRGFLHSLTHVNNISSGWYECFALSNFKMISETEATLDFYIEGSKEVYKMYIDYSYLYE